MTLWRWVGVFAIIALQGFLIYQARVWYNRQWLRHFRKHKMFRAMPPGFNDPRSPRNNYPQDHP
jgi:hypothetical protein